MVKDGEVLIVDEFTGRLMPGRRWCDGLHQAIEAKEGVKVENENQTLATISFQNYFRMYSKLSGMTGTADTEAEEFAKIYNLDVRVVPTNKPMIRKDLEDVVYKTEKAKFEAAAEELKELTAKGQPVLVGTVSIAKSEVVSKFLKAKGVAARGAQRQEPRARGRHHRPGGPQGRGHHLHQHGRPRHRHPARRQPRGAGQERGRRRARRARRHRRPGGRRGGGQAGHRSTRRRGRVEDAVRATRWRSSRPSARPSAKRCAGLGGLFILGTERHESRRIDNQLRGRAGRQGDPGMSRFYLSLEDDLMRIFGGERITVADGDDGHEGGRGHRAPLALQGHRERAEAGRGPQLRHPQEPARVRRRDEPAAAHHLRAAARRCSPRAPGVPLVEFTEDKKTKVKTRSEKMVCWADFREMVLDAVEDAIVG